MNERRLRVFHEVAMRLNMTEAANSLFISQPAISQTIRELEDDFGVKLFDRIGKKLFLTYEGDIFLTFVRRILNLYDDCSKTMRDLGQLTKGKLRIGASTTIGIYVLPDIIGKFSQIHPDMEISIAIENTKIISEMILQNKIDFAFVEGPVKSEEIIDADFANDEMFFITPPDHPWAKFREVDIHEVEKTKIIMREKGSGTRNELENLFRDQEVNYQIDFEMGNTEAIKKAVEAGLGVSCVSGRCIQREAQEGRLAVVRLRGIRIMREFRLIYHRDKFLSRLFNLFIDFSRHQMAVK